LNLTAAFVAALAGSASGITFSYILGRAFGLPLIHRYGKYLRIKEDHLTKAHAWFERVGHWGLTFGYFVPGIRHFTAYAAGMSCLEWPHFVMYAYSGAVLWVSTFIALGYFLGDRWKAVEENIHHYMVIATIAGGSLVLAWLLWRKWHKRGDPG
jgi:membrane protein DedA with SNARE-associated domain